MADSELVLQSEKGAPLTPAEMDNNLTWLNNRISAVVSWIQAILSADGTLKSPPSYYAVSATGVDDYAVTLSPTPSALSDLTGKLIILKADVANADENATLNPNALGATAITKNGTTALTAGEIVAGSAVNFLVFDGTQFQLKV